MLPAVCEALGLWPQPSVEVVEEVAEPVLPVADAAAEAAENPGSEVMATQVGGQDRGPRGRWARLQIRRTPRLADVPPVTVVEADDCDAQTPGTVNGPVTTEE
jgi:hypothetical protein